MELRIHQWLLCGVNSDVSVQWISEWVKCTDQVKWVFFRKIVVLTSPRDTHPLSSFLSVRYDIWLRHISARFPNLSPLPKKTISPDFYLKAILLGRNAYVDMSHRTLHKLGATGRQLDHDVRLTLSFQHKIRKAQPFFAPPPDVFFECPKTWSGPVQPDRKITPLKDYVIFWISLNKT